MRLILAGKIDTHDKLVWYKIILKIIITVEELIIKRI